jgi:hypothetical protein
LTGPLKEGKTEDDFITETVLRNPGDNPLCRLEAIIVSHNRQSYDIYVIPKKGEDWNKISKRMGFQYNGKFGVFGGDIDSPVFRGDNAFKWLREVMDITKSNEGRHLKVSMRIPGSDTKSPLDLIRKAFPITGARTSELDSVIFDEVIKPATEHTTSTANLQTSDDLLASYAKHQPQFTRGM